MDKLEKVLKRVAAALHDAAIVFEDGGDPEGRTPSMESVGVNSGVVIIIKEFADERHFSAFICVKNGASKATITALKDALGGKKCWMEFPSGAHHWEKGDVSVDVSGDGKSILIREEFERKGRL